MDARKGSILPPSFSLSHFANNADYKIKKILPFICFPVENCEYRDCASGDHAQAAIEEQQVEHDQDQAEDRNDQACEQSILAQGRTNDGALGEGEAYWQGAALKDGLESLCLGLGVVAGDGNLASEDGALNCRSGLDLAVQDDDDLAMVGD